MVRAMEHQVNIALLETIHHVCNMLILWSHQYIQYFVNYKQYNNSLNLASAL